MIIQSIKLLNFDLFYYMVKEKFKDEQYRNNIFRSHVTQIYDEMEIVMSIHNISMYEYLFLKMYSYKITEFGPDKKYNISSSVFDQTSHGTPFGDQLEDLNSLLASMKESGIDDEMVNLSAPAGMLTGNCIITLQGASVSNVIGTTPEQFFIKASKGSCVKDNGRYDAKSMDDSYDPNTDENLSNYIVESFIKSFYEFMNDRIQAVDLISDFMINKTMLSQVNESGNVCLFTVSNPYLQLNFTTEDIQKMAEKVKTAKEELRKEGNVLMYNMKGTEYHVVIQSSLYNFFLIYNALPKTSLRATDNIAIIRTNDYSEILNHYEALKNFTNRIRKTYSAIDRTIDDFKKDQRYIIYMMMTPNFNQFRYMINIKEEEVEEFISHFPFSTLKANPELGDIITNFTDKYQLVKKIVK